MELERCQPTLRSLSRAGTSEIIKIRLGDNIAERHERYIIGRDTHSRLATPEQDCAVLKGGDRAQVGEAQRRQKAERKKEIGDDGGNEERIKCQTRRILYAWEGG